MDCSIFISHSSKDSDFISQLNAFFIGLGVPSNSIFCSSLSGQDVPNGNQIEKTVRERLALSKVVVYVITKSFLQSAYCTEELGAGWVLSEAKNTGLFLIKLDDVSFDDLKGFIDDHYKCTVLTEESLSSFVDDLLSSLQLPRPTTAVCLGLIKHLLQSTSSFVSQRVEEKNKTDKEKQELLLKRLHESVSKLNKAEKEYLAQMYFADDRIMECEISDGTINMLVSKLYVSRCSSVSIAGYTFPYTLQPWVIDYIETNSAFKKELESLLSSAKPKGMYW